jgi:hypothetical protein
MKKFFKILFFFTALTACNYEPIFSSKEIGFSISSIKVVNENNLTRQIKRSLKEFQNLNEGKIYNIEISVQKIDEITAKDSKGNSKSFETKIICNLMVYKNKRLVKSKKIIENFKYNNNSDKFKLRKYKSNIENNLINRIIEKIILELYSL